MELGLIFDSTGHDWCHPGLVGLGSESLRATPASTPETPPRRHGVRARDSGVDPRGKEAIDPELRRRVRVLARCVRATRRRGTSFLAQPLHPPTGLWTTTDAQHAFFIDT